MKFKSTCFFIFFSYSLSLSALKIQPVGEFIKPLKISSLAQLKNLANINKNKVQKITANPFPLKTTKEVVIFSCLCPNWSTWNVFSDEEFYKGNCDWLRYASYIKKISFKIPIIIWQPLEESQKPYLSFNIPIFEGLQFDDRASIDIPNDIKIHTQQLVFLNDSNLYYFLKQGHTCDTLSLLASDWLNTLVDQENHLYLPQNLPSLPVPLVELGNGCFQNHPTLKKVTLNGIKNIQNNTFSNCFELTEVVADDLEEIGDFCFCNCPNLQKVHLKNLRTIGDFCFTNFCSQQIQNKSLEITVGNEEGFKNLVELLGSISENLKNSITVYLEF